MEVFDDTYVPFEPSEYGTASRIAAAAAEQPPTAQGGFVVRFGLRGGETTYVPLIGLPENPTAFRLDARPSSTEWVTRFGGPLLVVALGLPLYLYLEGKKKEAKAKKEAEKRLAGGASA